MIKTIKYWTNQPCSSHVHVLWNQSIISGGSSLALQNENLKLKNRIPKVKIGMKIAANEWMTHLWQNFRTGERMLQWQNILNRKKQNKRTKFPELPASCLRHNLFLMLLVCFRSSEYETATIIYQHKTWKQGYLFHLGNCHWTTSMPFSH